MPIFWERFRSSARVREMQYFQRYWYLAMILTSLNSERPGYLPNNPIALRAAADCEHTALWDKHSGVVLQSWPTVEDGTWRANQAAVAIGGKMLAKQARTVAARNRLLLGHLQEPQHIFVLDLASVSNQVYTQYPRKIGKAKALLAIAKAIKAVAKTSSILWVDARGKQQAWDIHEWQDAAKFILHAAEEFARSPAGNNGIYTPYPATWFNQARYFDDRREWYGEAKQISKQQSGFDAIRGVFSEPDREDAGELAEHAGEPGNGQAPAGRVDAVGAGSGDGTAQSVDSGVHTGMRLLPARRRNP